MRTLHSLFLKPNRTFLFTKSYTKDSKPKETKLAAPYTHKKQIFSGIQPTSVPHIGNYFGAIKRWAEYQNQIIQQNNKAKSNEVENPLIISIVDLHAITVPREPRVLNDFVYQCAATLIACGIDPVQSILYQQSQIPYHGQLSWILGCKVTLPQLNHMHQVKSKTESMPEIPLGIFSYPVLQTADILLFKGTHIPVGEDQLQHLELSRSIAAKFNNFYKANFFPLPKSIEGEFTRLKSLRDPLKKMSKSDPDQNGRIDMTDAPDVIVKKIRKAVTDSTSSISYDPEARPGVSTLVEIEAACTGKEIDEVVENCYLNDLDTGEYKKKVAEVLVEHLKPIQAEYNRLISDRGFLKSVLGQGAQRANGIAAANYYQVLKIIGANI